MGLGVAIAVVGAAVSAYGSYKGAQADARAADFAAEQARINARFNRMRARSVRTLGAREVSQFETDAAGFISEQITAFAGQGIAAESGVVSEVVESTARTAAKDVETIRRNTKLQAWGIEIGAEAQLAQAGALERRAAETRRLAPIVAGASILSTAGQLYYGLQRPKNPIAPTSPRGVNPSVTGSPNVAVNF
jgi:hypothetical protein